MLGLAVVATVLAVAGTGCAWRSSAKPNEGRPAYSRDGTWVAFTSDRTGTSQIYVARYGAPATRITDSKHGDGAPAWSPDGARIVFARLSGKDWPDPESTGLFVANRDGSGLPTEPGSPPSSGNPAPGPATARTPRVSRQSRRRAPQAVAR